MNVEIFNLSMTYPSGKTALQGINLNLSSPNLMDLTRTPMLFRYFLNKIKS